MEKQEYYKGMITKSGNFKLVKRIMTLGQLEKILANGGLVLRRHKVYHAGFLQNFTLRRLSWDITLGYLWTVKRVKK
jgi:hypothetical protein